jgi:hypothetical protein
MAAEAGHEVEADHQRHAGQPQPDADQLRRRRLFVGGQGMRHQHGEERRRRVEDRSQAAGDFLLAPEDQAERDRIVEQPHQQEIAPERDPARHPLSDRENQQMQCRRGDRDAREHDGERRQRGDRDLGEEERSTPDDGKQDQQQPVPPGHAARC